MSTLRIGGTALCKVDAIHVSMWRGFICAEIWGGEFENVVILVAIVVNKDEYSEVLGADEGMKEDKAGWVSLFPWLHGRGLDGVKLVVGDKCQGMLEAMREVFPEVKYQRCTGYFYRNVFSVTPRSKVKLVSKMLKAIHAQEIKKAAREKAVVKQIAFYEAKSGRQEGRGSDAGLYPSH